MNRDLQFFSYLDRVWVEDMIPCLIWPLSVSWHHHNGLGSQNTNLHIMKSAYLCKIDCISVYIDQFSLNFRYVVAKIILYKFNYNHFSFWWRHQSEIFRLKVSCQKWHNLRVMTIEGEFRSRNESTWYCFLRIFKHYLAYFCSILFSNISWPAHLYLFQTSIICLVYFSYFEPLFCEQDHLKMVQSNICKIWHTYV